MSDLDDDIISRVKKLIKEVEKTSEKVKQLEQKYAYSVIREDILQKKVEMWETLYKNMNTRMMN